MKKYQYGGDGFNPGTNPYDDPTRNPYRDPPDPTVNSMGNPVDPTGLSRFYHNPLTLGMASAADVNYNSLKPFLGDLTTSFAGPKPQMMSRKDWRQAGKPGGNYSSYKDQFSKDLGDYGKRYNNISLAIPQIFGSMSMLMQGFKGEQNYMNSQMNQVDLTETPGRTYQLGGDIESMIQEDPWLEARGNIESGMRQDSTSHAGATGMFQITPIALKEYNRKYDSKYTWEQVKQNPIANAHVSKGLIEDIRSMINKVDTKLSDFEKNILAEMAYNYGPYRFLDKLKSKGPNVSLEDMLSDKSLPTETRNHGRKFVEHFAKKPELPKPQYVQPPRDNTRVDQVKRFLGDPYEYKKEGSNYYYRKGGGDFKPINEAGRKELQRRKFQFGGTIQDIALVNPQRAMINNALSQLGALLSEKAEPKTKNRYLVSAQPDPTLLRANTYRVYDLNGNQIGWRDETGQIIGMGLSPFPKFEGPMKKFNINQKQQGGNVRSAADYLDYFYKNRVMENLGDQSPHLLYTTKPAHTENNNLLSGPTNLKSALEAYKRYDIKEFGLPKTLDDQLDYINRITSNALSFSGRGLAGQHMSQVTKNVNLDKANAAFGIDYLDILPTDVIKLRYLINKDPRQPWTIEDTNKIKEMGTKIPRVKRIFDELNTPGVLSVPVEEFMNLISSNNKSDPYKAQQGGNVNTTGYLQGSSTENNPYNIIPGGNITMQGVNQNINAIPMNNGEPIGRPIRMRPGLNYYFPNADSVLEIPEKQVGGLVERLRAISAYAPLVNLLNDPLSLKRAQLNNTAITPRDNLQEQLTAEDYQEPQPHINKMFQVMKGGGHRWTYRDNGDGTYSALDSERGKAFTVGEGLGDQKAYRAIRDLFVTNNTINPNTLPATAIDSSINDNPTVNNTSVAPQKPRTYGSHWSMDPYNPAELTGRSIRTNYPDDNNSVSNDSLPQSFRGYPGRIPSQPITLKAPTNNWFTYPDPGTVAPYEYGPNTSAGEVALGTALGVLPIGTGYKAGAKMMTPIAKKIASNFKDFNQYEAILNPTVKNKITNLLSKVFNYKSTNKTIKKDIDSIKETLKTFTNDSKTSRDLVPVNIPKVSIDDIYTKTGQKVKLPSQKLLPEGRYNQEIYEEYINSKFRNNPLPGYLQSKYRKRAIEKAMREGPQYFRYGGYPRYQFGGEVEPEFTPIQTERGERLYHLDRSISNVGAKKLHKNMMDDEITDMVPAGTFVASRDPEMRISKKEADKLILGNYAVKYEEGKPTKPPKDIKFGDIFKKRYHTPAELTDIIAKKFPISKKENNIFTNTANEENLASRDQYMNIVKYMTEVKKPLAIDIYRYGGKVKKAQWGEIVGGLLGIGSQLINNGRARNLTNASLRDIDAYQTSNLGNLNSMAGVNSLANILGYASQDHTPEYADYTAPINETTAGYSDAIRSIPLRQQYNINAGRAAANDAYSRLVNIDPRLASTAASTIGSNAFKMAGENNANLNQYRDSLGINMGSQRAALLRESLLNRQATNAGVRSNRNQANAGLFGNFAQIGTDYYSGRNNIGNTALAARMGARGQFTNFMNSTTPMLMNSFSQLGQGIGSLIGGLGKPSQIQSQWNNSSINPASPNYNSNRFQFNEPLIPASKKGAFG